MMTQITPMKRSHPLPSIPIVLLMSSLLPLTACSDQTKNNTSIEDDLKQELQEKQEKIKVKKEAKLTKTVKLQAGFKPDPIIWHGHLKTDQNVEKTNPNCQGWMSQKANIELKTETAFSLLHLSINSDQNIGLLLIKSDGTEKCIKPKKHDFTLSTPFNSGSQMLFFTSSSKNTPLSYQFSLSELSPQKGKKRVIH